MNVAVTSRSRCQATSHQRRGDVAVTSRSPNRYVTRRDETLRNEKRTRNNVFVASCFARTRQPRNHEHKGLTNGR